MKILMLTGLILCLVCLGDSIHTKNYHAVAGYLCALAYLGCWYIETKLHK